MYLCNDFHLEKDYLTIITDVFPYLIHFLSQFYFKIYIYIYFFFLIAENENFSVVEYHALQKELDERNTQRDELLFKIKVIHVYTH